MAFSITGNVIKASDGEILGESSSHSIAVRLVQQAVEEARQIAESHGQAPSSIQAHAIELLRQRLEAAPALCFGAILTVEAKHRDGEIIRLLDPFYSGLISQLVKDPDSFHQLDWRTWEEIIAASYDRAGFDEVVLTPRAGDGGRDVIATKHGFGAVRILEQVKAYSPHRSVKADEVRSLLGVLLSDSEATKAFLTTTSTFAPRIAEDAAIKQHIPGRLELVDKLRLLNRLRRLTAGG